MIAHTRPRGKCYYSFAISSLNSETGDFISEGKGSHAWSFLVEMRVLVYLSFLRHGIGYMMGEKAML